MPSTLPACASMMPSAVSIAASVSSCPNSLQRRVEHVAQPMQDHRLARLAQHTVIDPFVVGRRTRHLGQRAAGHDDQLAAEPFDCCHLHFVGADDIVDALRVFDREVVGAAAAGQEGAGHVTRRVDRTADQFQRCRPVQPHAALRGVHGLGHAQAHRPQPAAVGDGGVPVDGALQPRVDGGTRIGHHVRGGKGDAVQAASPRSRARSGPGHAACRVRACRQAVGRVMLHGMPQIASAGTSTQRRSFHDCSAASTSCTPLAPSRKVQR